MELECKKLFDPGVYIRLSEKFLKRAGECTWVDECIKAQNQTGALEICLVRNDNILVKTINGDHYYLTPDHINFNSLEKYRDNPEVLYAFTENQKKQGKLRNITDSIYGAFTWNSTPEGGTFWNQIALGYTLKYPKKELPSENIIDDDLLDDLFDYELPCSTQNKEIKQNNENHEIRLQKPKASIRRGTRPEGSRICSTEHKVAIRSRQVSYTACHC